MTSLDVSSSVQKITLTFLSANFSGRFKNGQSSTLGTATVNSLIRDTGAHVIFGQQSNVQATDIPSNFLYEGCGDIFIAHNSDLLCSFCSQVELTDRIKELAKENKVKLFGGSLALPINCVVCRIRLKEYEDVGFLAVSWFTSETSDSKKQRQIQLYKALNFVCGLAKAENISMILAGSFHLNTSEVDPVVKKLKSLGVTVDCYGYLKTSTRREIRASTLYFVSGPDLKVEGVRPRLLCGTLEIDTRSGLFKNLEDIFFYDPVFASVHLKIPVPKPRTEKLISDLQVKLQMISDCSISKRLTRTKPTSTGASNPKLQTSSRTRVPINTLSSDKTRKTCGVSDSTNKFTYLRRIEQPGRNRIPLQSSHKLESDGRSITTIKRVFPESIKASDTTSKSKHVQIIPEKSIRNKTVVKSTLQNQKSNTKRTSNNNLSNSNLKQNEGQTIKNTLNSPVGKCLIKAAKPKTARNLAKSDSLEHKKSPPKVCFDRIRISAPPTSLDVRNNYPEKEALAANNLKTLPRAAESDRVNAEPDRNLTKLDPKLEPNKVRTKRKKANFEDECDQLEILRQLMLFSTIEKKLSKEDDLVIGDSPSDREILCEYFLNHDRILSPIVELSESSSNVDSCCSSRCSSSSVSTSSTADLYSTTADTCVPSGTKLSTTGSIVKVNIEGPVTIEKHKLVDLHQSSSSAYGTSISEDHSDQESLQPDHEIFQLGKETFQVGKNFIQLDQAFFQSNQDALQPGQEFIHPVYEPVQLDQQSFQSTQECFPPDHNPHQLDQESFQIDCFTEAEQNKETSCYIDTRSHEYINNFVRDVVSESIAVAITRNVLNKSNSDIPTQHFLTSYNKDLSVVDVAELMKNTSMQRKNNNNNANLTSNSTSNDDIKENEKKADKYSWFQSVSFQSLTTTTIEPDASSSDGEVDYFDVEATTPILASFDGVNPCLQNLDSVFKEVNKHNPISCIEDTSHCRNEPFREKKLSADSSEEEFVDCAEADNEISNHTESPQSIEYLSNHTHDVAESVDNFVLNIDRGDLKRQIDAKASTITMLPSFMTTTSTELSCTDSITDAINSDNLGAVDNVVDNELMDCRLEENLGCMLQ